MEWFGFWIFMSVVVSWLAIGLPPLPNQKTLYQAAVEILSRKAKATPHDRAEHERGSKSDA